MRNRIFVGIISVFVSMITFGQAPPQGVNYQAVAYDNLSMEMPGTDATSLPLVNQELKVRFTILENSAEGTAIYSEEHKTETDENGLFNLVIGKGSQLSVADFQSIDWGSGLHFLKVELDINEGYNTMGTQQIWSVPYALYTEKAGNGVKEIIDNGTTVTFNLENGESHTISVSSGGGVGINWLGDFAAAPNTPNLNDAYYNSADGISYIWNGTAWNIIAKDGANGTNGIDGTDGVDGINGTNGTNGVDGVDGISINWLGEFAAAPNAPSLNDGYYNSTAGISYIWNGTAWNVIAKDGADGTGGSGAHNTLNAAYNQGGAGSGRVITVNNGAVEINHSATSSGDEGKRALKVTTNQSNSFGIDAVNSGTGVAIKAENTNVANTFAAIQAQTNSSGNQNSAIVGVNTGGGYAIAGQLLSSSTGEAAIYGSNMRTTGGHGVYGVGFNGVVGEATSGVGGRGVSGSGFNGLVGIALDGEGFGVYGLNESLNGNAIGTYGYGFHGVYGQTTDVTNGFAGYFTADLGVEGSGYSIGGWYDVSDLRLKRDIVPITNALERIVKLSGNYYTLTTKHRSLDGKVENRESKQYGVIAQEVEAEFPEMIKEKAIFRNAGDDTVYKTVNYDALVPVLIEAIKELKEEVDALKEEVKALKE